jgi:septal ring factor EnvC (AmiA/AmiB activator)
MSRLHKLPGDTHTCYSNHCVCGLQEAEAEITDLRAELAKMKLAHEKECEDLVSSNSSLQSRLKDAQDEIERLKKEAAQGSCGFSCRCKSGRLHRSPIRFPAGAARTCECIRLLFLHHALLTDWVVCIAVPCCFLFLPGPRFEKTAAAELAEFRKKGQVDSEGIEKLKRDLAMAESMLKQTQQEKNDLTAQSNKLTRSLTETKQQLQKAVTDAEVLMMLAETLPDCVDLV